VANCFSDYYDVARQQQNLDYKYIGLGNAKWFLANRLCYFLDIHGPSMTIDTACSSSLVALDLACQALKDGRCETAIVGGVNLSLHPSKYQIFCGLNALSKTGNSYPFDEKADGYVPGEAIAVLLLKPLDNAIKDNDQIHGVIKGSFVNSAGKSLGPIYPNQELETEVIIHTWQKAGIRPEQITYFEAHGTGTKVGDPLEFNAIKSAFLRFTDKRQFCALGTIKGNIGHTEAASGIAGVIKVLLQMKYHTIPILPNLNTINPMIDIDDSPLYFNQENIPWERKDETTRIGVVSSYGIATYAHIVIEDFLPQELHRSAIAVTEQKPFIILLSAKEKARLKEQVLQLLVFIQENKFSDASLPDMAYTLQVGREPMAERLAIVVESVSELVEKL
jgi:acyl transferase domain-containing protein